MNATGVLLGSALAAAALLAGCGSDSETTTVTETQTVTTSTGTASTTTEPPAETTSTTEAETTTTEIPTSPADATSCPGAESPPNILNVVPTGVDCATVESAMSQIRSVGRTFSLGEFQCRRTSGVRFSGIWTCVGAGGSFTFDFGD